MCVCVRVTMMVTVPVSVTVTATETVQVHGSCNCAWLELLNDMYLSTYTDGPFEPDDNTLPIHRLLYPSFLFCPPCRISDLIACFAYAPMKLYSVHLPPLRLTFNHPKQQQWLQDEYNDVSGGWFV